MTCYPFLRHFQGFLWDLFRPHSGSEFEHRAGKAAETGRPGSDRRAFAERGEIRRGVPVVRYLTSDCNPTSVRRQAEPIPAKRIFATSRQPPRYSIFIT
jgi:hypothetical protein